MDDATKAVVISQIFKHRHETWRQGQADAPSVDDFVITAAKIAGVSLTRDEVDRIAREVEELNGETIYTFDDMAVFLIKRVRQIGGPLA